MLKKLTNVVLLSLGAIGALWLLTSLAGVVQGGNLDPPAAPASTMQTLADLPPAWHTEISGAARFDDTRAQAEGYVLDRETGLVWEAEPDAIFSGDWDQAVDFCYLRTVAGEIGQSKGWRLPTSVEIGTLIDPMTGATPKLPAGHPFIGISGQYWTATRSAANTSQMYFWDSDFGQGIGGPIISYGINGQAWCVRSPSGFDISAP